MKEFYTPSPSEVKKAEEMTAENEWQAESTRLREEQKKELAEMGKEGYVLAEYEYENGKDGPYRSMTLHGSIKLKDGSMRANAFTVTRHIDDVGYRATYNGYLDDFKNHNALILGREEANEIFIKYEKLAIDMKKLEELEEKAAEERTEQERAYFEQALKDILS